MSTVSRTATRQERYRAFMRRFNPTAPPRRCIEEDLIVEEPSEKFARFAARADLDTGSQQLIVGGIGSGKTTQLMLAERWLSKRDNTVPIYVDVSAETDLATLKAGAVLASLGLHLANQVKADSRVTADVKKASDQIDAFAFGKTDRVWIQDLEPDYEPDYEPEPPDPDDWEPPGHYVKRKTPGKLVPRFPAMDRSIRDIRDPLALLTSAVRAHGKVVVAILDGLDRLMSPEKFWQVVHQDFRVLRELEISVLVAGPLSALFGQARPITDYVDETHHLSVHNPAYSKFPMEILRRRNAQELMEDAESESLCRSSGGVLRDLISLARNAAQEAYLDEGERIDQSHLSKAIRQLGEGYLIGLGHNHLAALGRLQEGGAFSTGNALHMELLVTRRVLEYQEPKPRYVVHPALAPLLEGS